jgi:hypothetical protein
VKNLKISLESQIKKIAFLIIAALPMVSCKGQVQEQKQQPEQKYCQLVKLEFSDPDAPQELKERTVDRIKKNVQDKKQPIDIRIENGSIVAKMLCENNAGKYFRSGRFTICETYNASELTKAIDGIAEISNSRGIPFDSLLDRNTALVASIGNCAVADRDLFIKFVNLPECKKLLPEDLILATGVPEEGGETVPVFAVKMTKTPLITVDMMKNARTDLSYNEVNYDVLLEFKKEYKATWEALTKKNSGKCLAIMLGDDVLSCPMLMGPIANGKASISANMTKQQAEEMAQRINSSLPLEVVISEVKML